MSNEMTGQAHFEEIYRSTNDPWNFATSDYELHRYDRICAALRDRHYRTAFEPGCSIGVLTALLAPIADHVFASDISLTAVERARERCSALENVQIDLGSLQDGPVPEHFDLLVLSEIGYYFEEAKLCDLVRHLMSRLEPGGTLLAAHWLGTSPDPSHILSGDRVHELLRTMDGLMLNHSYREEGFRLDRWQKS